MWELKVASLLLSIGMSEGNGRKKGLNYGRYDLLNGKAKDESYKKGPPK
jgi:hypothetical protein